MILCLADRHIDETSLYELTIQKWLPEWTQVDAMFQQSVVSTNSKIG